MKKTLFLIGAIAILSLIGCKKTDNVTPNTGCPVCFYTFTPALGVYPADTLCAYSPTELAVRNDSLIAGYARLGYKLTIKCN